jgi:hypothetical protein
MNTELHNLMSKADELIEEARNYLVAQGEPVDRSEWLTIKEYCARFNIHHPETVLELIEKGIITKDDTMVLKDMNSIRMIKANNYAGGITLPD